MMSVCSSWLNTWWSSNPGQAQHAVVKISVSENIRQAVVVMVLLRVQFQELLHTDVREAEWVGLVSLINGGVYLWRSSEKSLETGACVTSNTGLYEEKTHSDPFHHEADVANAHEVSALVDGIDGSDMTGDLGIEQYHRPLDSFSFWLVALYKTPELQTPLGVCWGTAVGLWNFWWDKTLPIACINEWLFM